MNAKDTVGITAIILILLFGSVWIGMEIRMAEKNEYVTTQHIKFPIVYVDVDQEELQRDTRDYGQDNFWVLAKGSLTF